LIALVAGVDLNHRPLGYDRNIEQTAHPLLFSFFVLSKSSWTRDIRSFVRTDGIAESQRIAMVVS
jgi:hypothetical protein